MLRVFLITILLACNPERKEDDVQIQKIIVKMGHSYKIDLEKETYTVYFMNGTSAESKFTLSDQERTDILKMSQECGLGKFTGNVKVEDNCNMFPKILTKMSFSAGGNNVEVSIDQFCKEHVWTQRKEAKRVLKFLKFLREKIFAKPEVAKAPKTDVMYL
jgi:hypothetical protein